MNFAMGLKKKHIDVIIASLTTAVILKNWWKVNGILNFLQNMCDIKISVTCIGDNITDTANITMFCCLCSLLKEIINFT